MFNQQPNLFTKQRRSTSGQGSVKFFKFIFNLTASKTALLVKRLLIERLTKPLGFNIYLKTVIKDFESKANSIPITNFELKVVTLFKNNLFSVRFTRNFVQKL